jgi:hypothetical protein
MKLRVHYYLEVEQTMFPEKSDELSMIALMLSGSQLKMSF